MEEEWAERADKREYAARVGARREAGHTDGYFRLQVRQCNLRLNGKRVCRGLDLSKAQRGVSLIGVKEADLKHLSTTQLGWPPGHEDMLRIAARLGRGPRKWAKLYRFNALHFLALITSHKWLIGITPGGVISFV